MRIILIFFADEKPGSLKRLPGSRLSKKLRRIFRDSGKQAGIVFGRGVYVDKNT